MPRSLPFAEAYEVAKELSQPTAKSKLATREFDISEFESHMPVGGKGAHSGAHCGLP
jgi:hypothetical protein